MKPSESRYCVFSEWVFIEKPTIITEQEPQQIEAPSWLRILQDLIYSVISNE
jgi:hypothetical protein